MQFTFPVLDQHRPIAVSNTAGRRALVALLALTILGCRSATHTTTGAATGAGVGALAGAVIGSRVGKPLQGAAIAGAAGGVTSPGRPAMQAP